jgi:dynein heavy chain
MLENEMDSTKKIYDEQKLLKDKENRINVHRNMPEVSGGLKWCQELRDRISKPMETFKRLIDHSISNSEQMERVNKKYKELLDLLNQFAADIYKTWCAHVGKLSNNNLEKNLIVRDAKTKAIKTNFDPQLIAVLKEVKYLGIAKTESVPPEAIAIYKQNDEYRKYITSLDYTVDSYNKIIKTASPEEKPLIQGELEKIDADLEKGEKNLKWNSPHIGEYINDTKNKVSDLETRLQKSKLNVEKIQTMGATWKEAPLFKRYEAKSTLLQLDDRTVRLDNRYKEIKEAGQKIHDLVKENQTLLNAANQEESANWKAYTTFVDRIVLEGMHKIIQCSLVYFLRETDYVKSNPDPLFEAQLQLKPSEMVFTPSMNYGDTDGFYELVEVLVSNVYKQGSLVARVAKHIGENYQHDLEARNDLSDMKQDLMERVNSILTKANEYKDSFNKYAYLWVDDRKEFMRQFLLYNHVLTQEEIEANAETGVPESPPTLEQFKEQVDQYEKTYDDVSKLDDVTLIDKWFRVDGKPFKTSLLNTIKKWSYMFKQHLMDDVTNSLKELDDFIKDKDKHLVKEVKEGDFEGLVSMMGHLGAVREKTNTYDNMFEPIKKKIELLKNYGQEVPDDVYDKLQVKISSLEL